MKNASYKSSGIRAPRLNPLRSSSSKPRLNPFHSFSSKNLTGQAEAPSSLFELRRDKQKSEVRWQKKDGKPRGIRESGRKGKGPEAGGKDYKQHPQT